MTVSLSLAAGLHAALHGAWKDSPSEGFKLGSFMRELLIAIVVGVALCRRRGAASPFLIFVSAYTLNRIVFEFYKMFVRRVPQDVYRIPTQIHWMGRVVTDPVVRLLLGVSYLGAIYGLYCLLKLLPDTWPPTLVGPVSGLAFGVAVAIGGGYKDGSVVGFELRKFVRSPVIGVVGGVIVSLHEGGLAFWALGAAGCERMLTELICKILRPGYVGGHFKTTEALFPEWVTKRRMFMLPYVMTWALFVALWVAGQAR